MLAEDRRKRILELIDEEGSVAVDELACRFDVSEMTIRRDLRLLQKNGFLKRVHGGATSNRGRSYEPPFPLRATEHNRAKAAIGKRAAELIQDGDSIALDVGTTTLELARHLEDRQNLTVITPSLHIANLLANHQGIRLILPGGIVRPGELSMVGRLAESALEGFYVDKLFLGIGGLDLQAGLTEFNVDDSQVKQTLLHRAKECIVVTDSSKFGNIAFAAIAPLNAIHTIVTDSNLDPDTRASLEEMDIEVIIAESDD
jgi:DeoR/GlpR family transcriptional regulator of sugar metabolism